MICKRFKRAVKSGNDVVFDVLSEKYIIYKKKGLYYLENCRTGLNQCFESSDGFERWKIDGKTLEELSLDVTEDVIYDYEYFVDMLNMGREIDFFVDGTAYFVSRNEKDRWYIFKQETQEAAYFDSMNIMLCDGKVNGMSLQEAFDREDVSVYIDYVY